MIRFAKLVVSALRDLAPIIVVIAFFQIVVLRQPFPDLLGVIVGLLCVIGGLTLFIQGLQTGLFPLGRGSLRASAKRAAQLRCLSSPSAWVSVRP